MPLAPRRPITITEDWAARAASPIRLATWPGLSTTAGGDPVAFSITVSCLSTSR
jgi:hypothetical protein